ncbi:hypothetical protein [Pedobacter sp. SYP-B3415]|uniref:hypothetical protein n=1 Tax=Pedobacter sp. SYP-B3415 TaxID=2496641 RepID=UPI0013EC6768|nr:hypothetical protein [Pedobacter sp. SYP-B3415]
MKNITDHIGCGQVPVHLKSLVKKPKPTYLVKTRISKRYQTKGFQLDMYYKSPI